MARSLHGYRIRSKGDIKNSVWFTITNQPGLGAAHNVDNGKLKSAAGVSLDPETIMIGGFRFGSVQKRVPGSEKISNDALQQQGPDTSQQEEIPVKESNSHADLGPNMQKDGTASTTDQYKILSAKDRMFAPQAAAHQYRPRNSGGSRIRSVAPGTKPKLRWCPTGLIHTQKRRVQRLRALEIREELAKKKRGKWFNQDKPMVPSNMTWKE